MTNERKIFLALNADDDIRFLKEGEYINMENIRMAATSDSKNMRLENIPGSSLLHHVSTIYTNKVIGSAKDYNRKRLIRFVYNNLSQHAIYAYDFDAKTTYTVLLSTQTEEGFDWNPDHPIDRNARIVNDLLIWTDNNDEMYCINIERGIKLNHPSYVTSYEAYVTGIPKTSITVIVRPPEYRLEVTKIEDTGFDSNFTANNAYQFYYRYWYKDYQYSVLSVFSALIPYNSIDETFNAIDVYMPFTEDIPDEVQQIDFCVRYGNFGKSFIIRSWNKSGYYDRIAMLSHNANITQLGFTFYDNISGIAIDDETANTAFDDVALKVKTLDLAKNRLFAANVLKGYDTPTESSLRLTISDYDTDGAGTYTADWKYFYLTAVQNSFPFGSTQVQFFYAYTSALSETSYYYAAYQSASPPASVNADDADEHWATETQLAASKQRNTPPPSGYHWQTAGFTFFDTGADTDLIFTVDVGNVQFFKSSSTYNVEKTFYDRYRRKCGVVKDYEQISTGDRTFEQTVFATTINWTLDNLDALNEIPDWAWYYTIDISLNLTTRFFEQIWIVDTNYANKAADGTFTYTTSYDETRYAVALNLNPLYNAGLGYTFTEGDMCRIYFDDDTNDSFPVLGQDGYYALIKPSDIGTLGLGVSFLVELYTPYRSALTEPFFETGDMMPILNPETTSRQYGQTSGSINGDCYAVERDKGSSGTELYFVEAMSPNDKVWMIWQTDRGWPNFIDSIGQQQKETAIDWSNTYLNGTKTNGLNKFRPLNTKDIGSTSGAIQKLQLASKQEENGTVMIVITTENSLSAYLSEIQISKAANSDGIITTDEVIGSINEHQNGRGTINPESVIEYKGVVWWVDVINGVLAQYSNNGVNDVSAYGMRGFFDKYSKRYIAQGAAAIEALCGFSGIHMCVDTTSGELLIILPQTEDDDYPELLPSYESLPSYASSIINRFNVYDGTAKMAVYKYEQNKWAGFYQWLPEGMEYFGNRLFGFKDGDLWEMNIDTDNFNTVFDVEYPQRICYTGNKLPFAIKDAFSIAIEGNKIPDYLVVYADNPNIQITDLSATDMDANGELIWQDIEGVKYAAILRDRLSPNSTGTADEKIFTGDVIKDPCLKYMIEFRVYNDKLILSFVDCKYGISAGHNDILQP